MEPQGCHLTVAPGLPFAIRGGGFEDSKKINSKKFLGCHFKAALKLVNMEPFIQYYEPMVILCNYILGYLRTLVLYPHCLQVSFSLGHNIPIQNKLSLTQRRLSLIDKLRQHSSRSRCLDLVCTLYVDVKWILSQDRGGIG